MDFGETHRGVYDGFPVMCRERRDSRLSLLLSYSAYWFCAVLQAPQSPFTPSLPPKQMKWRENMCVCVCVSTRFATTSHSWLGLFLSVLVWGGSGDGGGSIVCENERGRVSSPLLLLFSLFVCMCFCSKGDEGCCFPLGIPDLSLTYNVWQQGLSFWWMWARVDG